MIVVEEAVDPHRLWRHRALLGGFAEGGPRSALVAVPRAPRGSPGARVLGPAGPVDQ